MTKYLLHVLLQWTLGFMVLASSTLALSLYLYLMKAAYSIKSYEEFKK